MSVKTEVLKLLEASRERDLSGQEMAESLGVTRSAIWKAVNTLKEESDVLSEEGIRLCLHKPYDSQKIKVFKCIDSTNMEAKRCALNGEGEGLVILAEEQTNGRGRRGRSFYSPDGSGIYMSVLFRPAGNFAGCCLDYNSGFCCGMPCDSGCPFTGTAD